MKQIVFSALLEALSEIIGPDGKESIIHFAGLDKYSKKYLRPSLVNALPMNDLIKLSNSMNRLLGWGSKAILKETGRKFAIYLTPYGYSLDIIVEKLKKWIDGDWDISIETAGKEGEFKVTIKNDPFQANTPGSYIWTGFFEVAARNSSTLGTTFITSDIEVNENNVTKFGLKHG